LDKKSSVFAMTLAIEDSTFSKIDKKELDARNFAGLLSS